jgi:hypothetical protein
MPATTTRGRPSVLTSERAEALVELVRRGRSISGACAAVAVGRSSFYRRRRRDRRFREQVEIAREDAGARLVADLIAHWSDRDWRDAAALLERIAPERWSAR